MAADREIPAETHDHAEWHETIRSTNDRACEIAREKGVEAHGWIVGAEEQTAGRGRKGRQWISEPGKGLAFSLVVTPSWERRRWGWLSVAAALAVCEGGLRSRGLDPAIKWPNDILVGGRKICGILIEIRGDCAVIGIGLNVNERKLPLELGAVSMFQLLGVETDREVLVEEIREELMNVLHLEEPLVAERAWDLLAWKEEVVETSSGLRGRIRGFSENAELKVEIPGGLVTLSDPEGIRLAEPAQ